MIQSVAGKRKKRSGRVGRPRLSDAERKDSKVTVTLNAEQRAWLEARANGETLASTLRGLIREAMEREDV